MSEALQHASHAFEWRLWWRMHAHQKMYMDAEGVLSRSAAPVPVQTFDFAEICVVRLLHRHGCFVLTSADV